MTADDVVEAMARGIYEAKRLPSDKTWDEYLTDKIAQQWAIEHYRKLARAAIRAVTERGGLVVGKMPEPGKYERGMDENAAGMVVGWNAALAAVRAAAVTGEGV